VSPPAAQLTGEGRDLLAEVEELAWAAGVSPRESEDWSWGELLAAIRGLRLRQREAGQQQALIAYGQAQLTACALGGGRLPQPWETFPFWTEEEVKAARLAHYRRMMEGYAAAGADSPQTQ
jgi:hypothetical protein